MKRTPRRLSPDDVRQRARDFLGGWEPFRQRYGEPRDIVVEAIAEGRPKWAASVIPAMDIRCGVVIDDETGQVLEARLVAMRQGSIVAEWQPSAPSDERP